MILAAALTAIVACNAPAVHDGDTLRCSAERVRLPTSMNPQTSLFDLPPAPRRPMPDGSRYQPDLITSEEERDLVRQFAQVDFKSHEHLDYLGNRRVAAFGWRRGVDGAMVETAKAFRISSFRCWIGWRRSRDCPPDASATPWSPNSRPAPASAGIETDRWPWPSPASRSCRPVRFACAARSPTDGTAPRSSPRRARLT